MRVVGLFLFSLIPICQSFFYFFPRPAFDCRRIHPAHCCASRIRAACPQLCHRVPCNRGAGGVSQPTGSARPAATPAPFAFTPFPPFGQSQRKIGTEGSISPDTSPFGSVGVPNPAGPPSPEINPFGSVGVPNPAETPSPEVNPFGSFGIPSPPGPSPPGISPFGSLGVPSPAGPPPPDPPNPFPTLVPETVSTTPSISSFIEEKSINIGEKPFVGSNGAVDGEIRTGQLPKKSKKKGILAPPTMPGISPDELVELVDYGEEDGVGSEVTVPTTTIAPVAREQQFWTPPSLAVHRTGDLPESSQTDLSQQIGLLPEITSVSQFRSFPGTSDLSEVPDPVVHERTTIPVREASGSGIGTWRFVVKPSGYNGPTQEPVEVQPSSISEEHKAKADKTVSVIAETDESGSTQHVKSLKPFNQTNSIFTNRVGELIGAFFNNKTIFPPGSVKSGIPAAPPPRLLPETSTVVPRWTTTTAGVPVLIQTVTEPPPCGVAPHFTPCVSAGEASKKLLECCKRRLMPPGCLELCRYDVTQLEIRKAFDAGKCGILNVAPFLECASDGNNNLDCCRHRGVAQKSGSQCEVFCNPASGLGSLGLQHLVCQNVIGDLLQCHHSGVRR